MEFMILNKNICVKIRLPEIRIVYLQYNNKNKGYDN